MLSPEASPCGEGEGVVASLRETLLPMCYCYLLKIPMHALPTQLFTDWHYNTMFSDTDLLHGCHCYFMFPLLVYDEWCK